MANLQDVAKHAGVSVGTVSNVVNGRTDRIRPAMLQRVQNAIAELDYQPNRAARFLKTGETPLIGILVPSIVYPSWSWLAREIEVVAQEQYGYRVLVGNTYRDPGKEIAFLRDLLSHGIRGAIIVSPLLQQKNLDNWIQGQLVAVSYDRRLPPEATKNVDYVSIDHAQAARIAVNHLIENGHKRLAFVTVSGKSSSRLEKAEGFLTAVQTANLAESSEIIEGKASAAYGDDEMPQLGRHIAEQLATRRDRPTGIVALNDMLAIGLISGLQGRGLRVPEDVSVVGIDDLLISGFIAPGLTTVRPPVSEMARTMVNLIMCRLKDPNEPPQERIFTTQLIKRGSVAKLS